MSESNIGFHHHKDIKIVSNRLEYLAIIIFVLEHFVLDECLPFHRSIKILTTKEDQEHMTHSSDQTIENKRKIIYDRANQIEAKMRSRIIVKS